MLCRSFQRAAVAVLCGWSALKPPDTADFGDGLMNNYPLHDFSGAEIIYNTHAIQKLLWLIRSGWML